MSLLSKVGDLRNWHPGQVGSPPDSGSIAALLPTDTMWKPVITISKSRNLDGWMPFWYRVDRQAH